MSDLLHDELSEFFRLSAPLIAQMDGEASAVGVQTPADSRRPRIRRRPATTARPAGSGARRNERERNRVRQVNAGFDRLRDHVPQGRRNRKLSKVDTLRAAVEYISHLKEILQHSDGDSQEATFGIMDAENYPVTGNINNDVIGSWYLDTRVCRTVESETSMMQLLVSPEDITRALGGGSSSISSVTDHRLTVDICCSESPPPLDRSSFTGSAGCGACATPESVDHEVTSSSGSGPLDEDAEQLLNFASWLS